MRLKTFIAASVLLSLIAGAGRGAAAPIAGPQRALTPPASLNSAPNGAKPPSIEALFSTASLFGATWSEGGKSAVFSTDLNGRANAWLVEKGGGAAHPLAPSDERQLGPKPVSNSKDVVVESDTGGAETFDLMLLSPDGKSRNLTSTPDISETGPVVDAEGRRVAFARKVRGQATTDLAVLALNETKLRVLTHESDPSMRWQAVAFTPDGQSVVADRLNVQSTKASAWRVPLDGGAPVRLTTQDLDRFESASAISPDGRWLAVSTNRRGEQLQAGLIDLRTGALRLIHASDWKQSTSGFSPDGRWLVFTENVDGQSRALLYDMRSDRVEPVSLPKGLIIPASEPFSADGRSLLFAAQAGNRPPELWVFDLPSRRGIQLTHLTPPSIAGKLPQTQIVHYSSFDGTVISGLAWVPPGLKRDRSAPAVFVLHGGPTGQFPDNFSRDVMALASRGFIVLAPNVRGSTGYGRAFQAANYQDLGGGDLLDVAAGVQFLKDTGFVDQKRIGVMGGSYGGFLTIMALAKTPRLWAAGVDLFGVLDWRKMLTTSDPSLQVYVRELMGDPASAPEAYDRATPLTYIDQLKAPLLVLQGDNDVRVPKSEASDLVSALRARGGTVDVVFYPQEGHGFFRREHQIDSLRRTIDWFERYLKGPRP